MSIGTVTEVKAGANINWPVVAGIGILGAVAFYLLYSVNELLGQVESVVVSPLANLETGIGSALSYLNPKNWFDPSQSTSGE